MYEKPGTVLIKFHKERCYITDNQYSREYVYGRLEMMAGDVFKLIRFKKYDKKILGYGTDV